MNQEKLPSEPHHRQIGSLQLFSRKKRSHDFPFYTHFIYVEVLRFPMISGGGFTFSNRFGCYDGEADSDEVVDSRIGLLV
jgi:hypothetical protein